MKILLFGKNGQVGWELNRSLQPLGEIVALGREQADFADLEGLRRIVLDLKPDIIVNAVAYTNVDKAEDEEETAYVVNAEAPKVLAEVAIVVEALLVHYSTDYVFDGTKNSPYVELDAPNPVNAYGRTKLAGEVAIQTSGCEYLIFRTSWVYASRGHNFLLTILRLAKEVDELSIVSDQVGSPTSARLIAETTVLCIQQLIREKQAGIITSDLYHLSASDHTSWSGFAGEIISIVNKELAVQLKTQRIKSIPTEEYPTPAQRPMRSQLALTKLEKRFCLQMPDWKKILELCLLEVK